MAEHRTIQKEIARQANVHVTTVSLALRNSPKLPESTKERIRKLAEDLGYRRDPLLTALSAYRRNFKVKQHQDTLAWITPREVETHEYFTGVKERCAELGYTLERFSVSEFRPARLSKILRSRGIQGLLIAPQGRNRTHLRLTWEHFSSVTFGYTLVFPQLHMVTNAQYRSARACVRMMRSFGYRRIGYVDTHNSNERTDQNFVAGYYAECMFRRQTNLIPPLIVDDLDYKQQRKSFDQWYKQHRPDALVIHFDGVPYIMQEFGISFEQCGVATLTRSTRPDDMAGICQNEVLIGRTAVDFLVSRIHLHERGIPLHPLRTLVPGSWHNGYSIPRKTTRRALA